MGHPSSPTWTLDFAPAVSPRFSPTLSPRSYFHTRQRFPISNHVTSGWMSPRSSFDHWSAVSQTGSSSGHVIALGQSGARKSAIRARFTTVVCLNDSCFCDFLGGKAIIIIKTVYSQSVTKASVIHIQGVTTSRNLNFIQTNFDIFISMFSCTQMLPHQSD